MRLTELGGTGLATSAVGLGLASLARPGYINLGHGTDFGGDLDPEHVRGNAVRVLDAAKELGVLYFDAARSYGRAEEFLAHWLTERSVEPGGVTVGSKWGYTYTADWKVNAETHEVKDHSLRTLRRQHRESMALLGPWLGLYQVHSATLESGILDDDAVLDELATLRERGLRVGLTTSGTQQSEVIRRAIGIERSGVRVFDTVQSTFNVLERSAEGALREAHGSGLGVIVKEALANGRLTERNGSLAPPVSAALSDAGSQTTHDPTTSQFAAYEQAAFGHATFDQVALAFVLAQDFVDVALSGATTTGQLRSNVGALDLANDLDLDVFAGLSQPVDEYWQDRSRLPWT
ncbi:MAG: aldo/keto reductase [Microthrixaceae bacterium]